MRCPTLAELPPPPAGKTGWPWTEDSPAASGLPKLTIVTPSFNQAQFIEETIRSVLLQGYPDLEYMIVDGGSTDGSVEIIRRYEPWLAHWVSEPDAGQSDAINKGWRRATGDIIAYLNSDDTYCPRALATAAAHLATGLVYGNYHVIDGASTLLETRQLCDLSFAEVLGWLTPIPQPATFLRRDVLDSVGLLNPALHYTMDYELCLRVGRRFPMRHVSAVLANLRIHESAKTVAGRRRFLAELRQVADDFFHQPLPPEVAALKHRTLAAHAMSTANWCYGTGAMSEARVWAVSALRRRPPAPIARKSAAIFLKSLLGYRCSAWLRDRKHQHRP